MINAVRYQSNLELPILFHGLDSPVEFLAESLGEELFDGHIEFLREDYSEAWVDVILQYSVSHRPSHPMQ
jgi:hypothetical protein